MQLDDGVLCKESAVVQPGFRSPLFLTRGLYRITYVAIQPTGERGVGARPGNTAR